VTPRRVHRPLLGIAFMLGSATLFPIMNGIVKYLSKGFASEQIIWARNLGHFLFMLLLFTPRRGFAIFRTIEWKTQILRSIMLLASTVCFFVSVKYLALAKASAINFASPFMVMMLAWAVLGEKLLTGRVIAIIAAFIGVLVIVRPGTSLFEWAALLPLGSALFYATYQVFTRVVAGRDTPETSVVYSALVGSVVMTFTLPGNWRTPTELTDILLLASLGVLGGIGHYCVARAMINAEASLVSPFNYWQIVGSSLFGLIVFSEWPDAMTFLGSGIIIAAGVAIAWNERQRELAARAQA
jgi:drug/metabolite transporter (DMT)-like permease